MSVAATALLLVGQAAAVVMGPDDSALDHGLGRPAEDQFDSIGRIECLEPNSNAVSHNATAWVMGNADTVVTAAHAFYLKPDPPRRMAPLTLDPRNCIFVLFARDQTVRQIANIRYAVSPWSDRRLRRDSAHDVAVVRLDRRADVSTIPLVRMARAFRGTPIRLYSYQTGVRDEQLLRMSRGIVEGFPRDQLRPVAQTPYGTRISDAESVFATSANSGGGSSGGLYYYEGWKSAIGIHLGSICEYEAFEIKYNRNKCFNYGLYFTKEIFSLVAQVNDDLPRYGMIINPDEDAPSILLEPGDAYKCPPSQQIAAFRAEYFGRPEAREDRFRILCRN